MGQRSSIDRLPAAVRGQVDQAIAANATIDEVIGLLLDLAEQGKLSATPSRSAVGRYAQQYRKLAERQREIASVAKAFASDFGSEDDMQGRLAVQLVTTLITRAAMAEAEGEEVTMEIKDLHFLSRALKDAVSAAKIDDDRVAKIREDARQEALRNAAEAAETEGKKAGASAETINRVKRGILGLS
jgi:hypothetical protein